MTDKELLEKAAKSYGLFNNKYCEAWKAMAAYDSVEDSYYGESWNPLQDDGDALRLAVNLGIKYCYGYGLDGEVQRVIVDDDLHVMVQGGNAVAATRRAITRAAVTIYENS